MTILENLFASKTQAKILSYLFKNLNQKYYQRQLCKLLGESLGSIQYEVNRLENIGVLNSSSSDGKKFYQINKDFFLYPQLRDIILKVHQQKI